VDSSRHSGFPPSLDLLVSRAGSRPLTQGGLTGRPHLTTASCTSSDLSNAISAEARRGRAGGQGLPWLRRLPFTRNRQLTA
jgi:hypothetical protein